MTPEYCIAPATQEDLDAIVALEAESFSEPWSRKMFEVELHQNQFGRLFVARPVNPGESDLKIFAYICVWCVFEELRIMNLAVAPPVRRAGIARKLVRFVLGCGLAQGTQKALLEVRASNAQARALYARFGFLEYGRRTGYYRNPQEDAILMRLDPIPSHYSQSCLAEKGKHLC